MKHFFVAVFAGLLLACSSGREEAPVENSHTNNTATENVTDTVVSSAEVMPVATDSWSIDEIDSSGWIMMKLYLNGEGAKKSDSKISLYGSRETAACWNILFYNSRTGEQHLLTEQRMILTTAEAKTASDSPTALDSVILYQSIPDDLNKDGQYDENDAAALFISDRTGKHFRRITPKGLHLNHWQYIEASNSLLLTCLRDSNKNQQYNQAEDESLLFQWSLTQQDGLKPVLSKTSQQKINDLLKQQWTVKQQ